MAMARDRRIIRERRPAGRSGDPRSFVEPGEPAALLAVRVARVSRIEPCPLASVCAYCSTLSGFIVCSRRAVAGVIS
jgi:hypothetical protein